MELHLEIKAVGKGAKGRTACGSSAYRACDRLIDNAGNVHDYSHKGGYVAGGIELPQGASEELRDRQTLWSRHEKRDVRKDAELFREITLALPNEFSYSSAEKAVRDLCGELTKLGMCVQWDIHDTSRVVNAEGKTVAKGKVQEGDGHVEIRNLHVHMMVTMRELLPDGTFGKKNRSWNRYNGGLNFAELLRPRAAEILNDELARNGSSEHVECESYADRGIDKIPQRHMGVAAAAMERRGVETAVGKRNRYIDWLNQIHAQNLREAESHKRKLDSLIAKAQNTKDGQEVFKDWDALFALLRDIRRAKAALKSEQGKLAKVISAYEEGNNDYLKWTGFDPDNAALRLALRETQEENSIKICQLELAEELILDSKELFKAHNKVVYTSNKAAWDQYQIERKGRRLAHYQRRMKSLGNYASHLRREVSLLDALFNTAEYQEYLLKVRSLEAERAKVWEEYQRTKNDIQQHKQDLKQHKADLKDAIKSEKQMKKVKKDGHDR